LEELSFSHRVPGVFNSKIQRTLADHEK